VTKRQSQRENGPEYATSLDWDDPSNADEIVTQHPDRLDDPFEYTFPDGPGRIFVVSMGDLFHPAVDTGFIHQVINVAHELPKHEFIFLTKRPDRAGDIDIDWPENAIVGTSVGSGPGGEYADTTHRIDQLRKVDARRWISFEPLIEPIGDVDLSGIEWIVVGGENASDEDRREMQHKWAEDLLQQARNADHDIAYHFKQSSAATNETGIRLTVTNEHGYPEQRLIREFPPVPQVVEDHRQKSDTN
jgi:protein gp37